MRKSIRQVVDYTSMRLSKKQSLVKCPKCGRKGKLHRYLKGEPAGMVVHRKEERSWYFEIVDSCLLRREELP
jgi:hypothetical protein